MYRPNPLTPCTRSEEAEAEEEPTIRPTIRLCQQPARTTPTRTVADGAPPRWPTRREPPGRQPAGRSRPFLAAPAPARRAPRRARRTAHVRPCAYPRPAGPTQARPDRDPPRPQRSGRGESPLDRTAASVRSGRSHGKPGRGGPSGGVARSARSAPLPPAGPCGLTPVASAARTGRGDGSRVSLGQPRSGTAAPGGSGVRCRAGGSRSGRQPGATGETPAACIRCALATPMPPPTLPDDPSTISVRGWPRTADTAPRTIPRAPGRMTPGRAAIRVPTRSAPEPAVPDIPEFRPAASPPAPLPNRVGWTRRPPPPHRAPAEPRRFRAGAGLAARAGPRRGPAAAAARSRVRVAPPPASRGRCGTPSATRAIATSARRRPVHRRAPVPAAPPSTAAGPTAERSVPLPSSRRSPTDPRPLSGRADEGFWATGWRAKPDRPLPVDPSPICRESASSGTVMPGPVAGRRAPLEPAVACCVRGESRSRSVPRRIRPGPRGRRICRLWLVKNLTGGGARHRPRRVVLPAGHGPVRAQ